MAWQLSSDCVIFWSPFRVLTVSGSHLRLHYRWGPSSLRRLMRTWPLLLFLFSFCILCCHSNPSLFVFEVCRRPKRGEGIPRRKGRHAFIKTWEKQNKICFIQASPCSFSSPLTGLRSSRKSLSAFQQIWLRKDLVNISLRYYDLFLKHALLVKQAGGKYEGEKTPNIFWVMLAQTYLQRSAALKNGLQNIGYV